MHEWERSQQPVLQEFLKLDELRLPGDEDPAVSPAPA